MALTLKQAFAHFWAQVVAQFVRQESGKGLSTNDFTTADKNRVAELTDDYINALIDARITTLPSAEEGAF